MDFKFTEEEQSFRQEVRDFLERELTEDIMSEMREWEWNEVPMTGYDPGIRKFGRKLGERRLLGISWPKEYGGEGGSFMKLFIVCEELQHHGAIIPNIFAVTMVGPTILRFGTEEQKKEYLPRIARGEIEFALGYTEPQAGSDIAALEIKAVEDGDDYVINGQKMFNTACHYADYHWLAVRTDWNVPKRLGISMFIVDLKSPGITIRPLHLLSGGRTNEVFYDNVRVPKRNLVGKKNQGWSLMGAALSQERLIVSMSSQLKPLFDNLVQYFKENESESERDAKYWLVREKLARLATYIEVGRLLGCYTARLIDQGAFEANIVAARTKIFVSEVWRRLADTGMDLLAPYGQLQADSKWALLDGGVEKLYRTAFLSGFGAGSNEVLRSFIANAELKLPRG